MRWKRVVIGAVLGGLLGFGGQFVIDFFWWTPQKGEATMNSCARHIFSSEPLMFFDAKHMQQAQGLYSLGFLLVWLDRRADLATRSALIVAFFGASAAVA